MIDQWEKAFKTSCRNQEIVLHGKIIKQKNGSGNNWEFSDRFFAVLHKISKLELGDTPVQLFELHLKEPGKSYAHCNDPQLPDHLKRHEEHSGAQEYIIWFKYQQEANAN